MLSLFNNYLKVFEESRNYLTVLMQLVLLQKHHMINKAREGDIFIPFLVFPGFDKKKNEKQTKEADCFGKFLGCLYKYPLLAVYWFFNTELRKGINNHLAGSQVLCLNTFVLSAVPGFTPSANHSFSPSGVHSEVSGTALADPPSLLLPLLVQAGTQPCLGAPSIHLGAPSIHLRRVTSRDHTKDWLLHSGFPCGLDTKACPQEVSL